MYMYNMTKEELENHGDVIKIAILRSLVVEGLISYEEAEKWSSSHGIKLMKKNIWRTLSDRWKEETEAKGLLYTVVRSITSD